MNFYLTVKQNENLSTHGPFQLNQLSVKEDSHEEGEWVLVITTPTTNLEFNENVIVSIDRA